MLLARQTVRVDARLVVAGVQEQVEVRGARPIVETDRATIDSSKSGDEINKLALNFRATNNTSPIVVATLSEGVQQDRSGAISIAGNLPFMTSFSVDGISTQRTRGGGPSRELFPSVESIAEFKVSAANNNAEFMQVTDITTTTKSGTNNLHGTAFWFGQNSRFTAVNDFTPRDANGAPIKPQVQANSFGVSSGGPIVRNRLFFFATYEGVRRPNEVTLSELVPPDAFRAGDLSTITRPITNPFTGQPFANNQIPVHPSSAAILDTLYAKQNQSTGAALNRPNHIVNAPGDFQVDALDLRVDQTLTPSQKLFGRFTSKNVDSTGPASLSFNTMQGTPFSKNQRPAARRLAQLRATLEPAQRSTRRLRLHARGIGLPARGRWRRADPALRLHRPAADAGLRRHSGVRFRGRDVHRHRRRQAAQRREPDAPVQRQPDVDLRAAQRQGRRRHPARDLRGSGHVFLRRGLRALLFRRLVFRQRIRRFPARRADVHRVRAERTGCEAVSDRSSRFSRRTTGARPRS